MKLKLPNGVELEELTGTTASVRMRLPFARTYSIQQPKPEVVAQMASLAQKRKERKELQGAEDPTPDDFSEVDPQEADYIYPLFRALSAEIVGGYWLDFSEPNVVKDAAPLLYGQTIYTNHRFYDVERWIGAVNASVWDAKGERTEGVPGINVELKIDWKVAPRIARGLLMKPPAIHSVSATLEFEWRASHPELLEKRIFWSSLGEEIDGEIVRIIVTKILSFWELSLVFQGADRRAKQLSAGDDEQESLDRQLADPHHEKPKLIPIKKEHTVKLTAEQKKILGLEAHTEEDVADAIVVGAGQKLSQALSSAVTERDELLGAARAECLRVATLAVGVKKDGATEATLPEAIANIINNASAKDLKGLTAMYTEQANAHFVSTCKHCGSHEIAEGRSSLEDAPVAGEKPSQVIDTSIL